MNRVMFDIQLTGMFDLTISCSIGFFGSLGVSRQKNNKMHIAQSLRLEEPALFIQNPQINTNKWQKQTNLRT